MGEGDGFYAHTPVGEGEWHELISHLRQTAALARKNGDKFGAGEVAYLAGLWHDIGKFNPEFQKYLRDCERAERSGNDLPPKSVPHAAYGASFARRAFPPLTQIIHGHHAGLQELQHVKSRLDELDGAVLDEVLRLAWENVEEFGTPENRGALLVDPPKDDWQSEFFLRMVFSALVDADFLDTERHFDPESAVRRSAASATPGEMRERLERDQDEKFGCSEDTPVNGVRREVYEACVRAARLPQGVFRLSVPTGGGKTRSGLAFALRHAMEHGMDRVIAAAPYTSIIEQTAGTYRSIFGEENVLEHHSAVRREPSERPEDPGEDERLDERRERARLAAQNWDVPLIVTTTVQLFESLFANRTSRCRRLHNIARSVIVLDEVQTVPLGLLAPILSVLRELVRRYHVSVVLCTATQPALDERSRYLEGFGPGEVRDIVPQDRAAGHFRSLRRVEYETPEEVWDWDDLAERVLEESGGGSALVVLNARRDALEVLDQPPSRQRRR